MKNLKLLFAGLAIISTAVMADIKKGQEIFGNTCVGCHGVSGEGGVGPKLATGKPAKYFEDRLITYKLGKPVGPMTSMMAPMAAGLSDEDIKNVSEYISTLK